MPELDFQLSSTSLRTIRTIVEVTIRSLKDGAVIQPLLPEIDPEFVQAWQAAQAEHLRADCCVLIELFHRPEFGKGKLQLSDVMAEGVLRAASALRLQMQQTVLRKISAAELESGDVDFYQLQPLTQQAYGCYIFLASLQESLVLAMEPSIGHYYDIDEEE